MSVQNLQEILSKLESFWEKRKTPILSKLNSALEESIDEIPNFTGSIPIEVHDLYNWKNGVNPTPQDLIGNLSMFPGGIFLSFDKAKAIQNEMAGDEFGWDKKKFPLFESGGGEYILIEADSTNNTFGMLFYHSIGAVEFKKIISIYDSIYSLFITIYECFKTGVYEYDKGILESDNEKQWEICKKMNPRSDYWKLE